MEIVMNRFITVLLSGAVAAALAGGAQAAASMTKSEYEAAKDQAEAAYKADKARCASLGGNAKDICQAEAKAQRMRADADAKAAYKNDRKAWYHQKVAHADADYLVAKEKCDDLSGNDKDLCQEQAKAAHTKATADAKAARKSGEAQSEARKETSDARKDAAEDKRDADYKVELERCDNLAGGAKDQCVKHAKEMFGKS
jgi:hypothetical protein